MNITLNIQDLHTALWGKAPFPVLLARENDLREYSFLTRKKTGEAGSAAPKGVYDSSYISEFEFSYGDNFENSFKFSIPPVFAIKNQLNITETVIVGQSGTVKETASMSDWSIEMKGYLINESYEAVTKDGLSYDIINSEFPQQQLRDFRDVYERCKPIKITKGILFSILGIEKIIIKSLNFDELSGYVGIIPFSCSCVSDRDFELEEV